VILATALGYLALVGGGELADRLLGVLAVFGVADLRQRLAGGLGRFRQAVQHVHHLVHPAAALPGLGEDSLDTCGRSSKPLHPRGNGRHGVKGHAYRPNTLYEVVLRDGDTTGFTKPDGRYLRLCRTVVRLGTPFRSAPGHGELMLREVDHCL
jgi:hypothetical protein